MDWFPLLVCPICRGELTFGTTAICADCARSYPIESGVPVLLPASPPGVEHPEAQTLMSLPVPLQAVAARLRPYLAPQMTHKSSRTRGLIPAFVASVSGVIVNVGSGTRRYGPCVLNLDIARMDGVDVIGTSERLPLRDEAFDGAILQAVLEHVEDGQATLAELNRVLRPGGAVFVEIPFMQGYHGGPSDFRRFTELGLQRELERHGFEVGATGVAVGPGSGAAWILSEYLALLFSVGSRSYRASRLATRWLTWPLKWTDAWLDRHPMGLSLRAASGPKASRPPTGGCQLRCSVTPTPTNASSRARPNTIGIVRSRSFVSHQSDQLVT